MPTANEQLPTPDRSMNERIESLAASIADLRAKADAIREQERLDRLKNLRELGIENPKHF